MKTIQTQRKAFPLRRGGALVYVLVTITVLISFAAMSIDLGRLYVSRSELQAAADAAALAGANVMLDETRLRGYAEQSSIFAASRAAAVQIGQAHVVSGSYPEISNLDDIWLGHLLNPSDPNEEMDSTNPNAYNSVRVRIRRSDERNGPIEYLFAQVFGRYSKSVIADATATFREGIVGYRVTDRTGNADLLPLALHVISWNEYLAGTRNAGDNFTYDPDTGQITSGPDGIPELNIYPGSGGTQLPPGNFGTVDIGSPNNSTADIARQIRYGVNADDLAYFGGELRLGPNGTVVLNGDTGLSAGIKDDLISIRGRPRSIPLFSSVAGPGNNANFTVVSFAGIRIMEVVLTGPMKNKRVLIQPAYAVDDAAISGGGNSYFVYRPVELVR